MLSDIIPYHIILPELWTKCVGIRIIPLELVKEALDIRVP